MINAPIWSVFLWLISDMLSQKFLPKDIPRDVYAPIFLPLQFPSIHLREKITI